MGGAPPERDVDGLPVLNDSFLEDFVNELDGEMRLIMRLSMTDGRRLVNCLVVLPALLRVLHSRAPAIPPGRSKSPERSATAGQGF